MKKATLLILISLLLITGCSVEQYGAGVSKEAPAVKVKDVVLNPSLQGKVVNLEGIITTQCGSNGCWFFLHDGSGQIFIDLSTKGFSIPPKQGKKAKVTGVVSEGQSGMQIIAYGVEIG
jgi:uncharacterized protein YdeI (BOF family)